MTILCQILYTDMTASLCWNMANGAVSTLTLYVQFFQREHNIYLHFMSFLQTDKTQVVEIPSRVRQGPAYST